MGFLDFLFGGKKKDEDGKEKQQSEQQEQGDAQAPEPEQEAEAQENEAQEPETREPETEASELEQQVVSGELGGEADASSQAQEGSEARATMYGMPAPDLPQPQEAEQAPKQEEAEESNEPRAVSGEMVAGEMGAPEGESSGAQESEAPSSAEEGTEESAVPAATEQAPTEPMEEDEIEKMLSSGERVSSGSFIICKGCGKRLPVPYVGYPSKITCPFCLTVNEYNM